MRPGLLLLTLCTACASGASTVDGAHRTATVYTADGMQSITSSRPNAFTRTVDKPPAVVATAVQAVLAEYEIPITFSNPATGQYGNADFYKSRQLAGRPMVSFLDCGTRVTGPNAASFRIYMSLVTAVTSASPTTTTVSVTFSAAGRDLAGSEATARVPCSSNGRFENMLLDRVIARASS